MVRERAEGCVGKREGAWKQAQVLHGSWQWPMTGIVGSEKQASWPWVVISFLILLWSINMFTCMLTLSLNPQGAERVMCCQRMGGDYWWGSGGPSSVTLRALTDPQLFRAALVTAVGGFYTSPFSSWPLSEDCLSSLGGAISDQGSVGETFSLSFVPGRMLMNTRSVVEHIRYKLVEGTHF